MKRVLDQLQQKGVAEKVEGLEENTDGKHDAILID